MAKRNTAKVLYGATGFGSSSFSADMLWKTKFSLHDPEFFMEIGNKSYLFINSLEYSRAIKEARVDVVIDYVAYREKHGLEKKIGAILKHFLKEHNVRSIIVPRSFPLMIADGLRKSFIVTAAEGSFYSGRAKKSKEEIGHITSAQQMTEQAMCLAKAFLSGCSVKGKYLYSGNIQATSEQVKDIINLYLYQSGYFASDTIVASGLQGAQPHNTGSGPLYANTPIIVDIFPVHLENHYYGDMTRTFFKGEPQEIVQKAYSVLYKAQTKAIQMVRAGVKVSAIHSYVADYIAKNGYPMAATEKGYKGFIHSTGHGLGLEIHEDPYVGGIDLALEADNVITIEPGIYDPEWGGMRIEDIVVVRKNSYKNLNMFPKDYESMIL